MMKTYYTNENFDKETYVKCLNKIGVTAKVVAEGVELNIDEYKKNYNNNATHIIIINHKFVKSL